MRCSRVATPERWCWRPNQTGSHQSLARLCQFRAECWVGDLDQRAGVFGERAAAPLGNSVLGDDEVGLGAQRGDDAIRQARDNARSAAVAVRGLQRDDRVAFARTVGGAHKIHLPATDADMPSARGFSIDLGLSDRPPARR